MSQWYLHGKDTSMAQLALQIDCAFHKASQLGTDTEPQASSSELLTQTKIALHEWLKDLVLEMFRYTRPTIFDFEFEHKPSSRWRSCSSFMGHDVRVCCWFLEGVDGVCSIHIFWSRYRYRCFGY